MAKWRDINCTLDNASDVGLSLSNPIKVADEDLYFDITEAVTPSEPYEQSLNFAKLPVLVKNADAEYAQVFNNGVENF